MYCKKCGKEYPDNKKVCTSCGLALTKGKPRATNKNSRMRIIIISGCLVAAVIALVLILAIPSMIVHPLIGTWYDQGGILGTIQFNEQRKAERTSLSVTTEYSYTFDGRNGKLTAQGEEYDFTCDGKTLVIEDATYTKNVVDQFGPEMFTSPQQT